MPERNKVLTEDTINALGDRLSERIDEFNTYYLQMIAARLKELGVMSVTDTHRLNLMRRYGADVDKINRELERMTALNVAEIYVIYDFLARESVEYSKVFYDYAQKPFIPYEENKPLQRWVKAQAEVAAREYAGLSNTTAYMTYDARGRKVPTDLTNTYTGILDKAIQTTTLGYEDFYSSMRKSLKALGEEGLQRVDYATGYHRRLDSAVRMNLLEGIKQTNIEIQRQVGEEFGADGVEISAHRFSAPDHEPIQGRQYTHEAFEQLNNSLQRRIGTLNCYHFVFQIKMGAPPKYTEEELRAMADENARGIEFEGKHYTMYQATQIQRRMETNIRRQKDVYILAKGSGDEQLRRETRAKINALKDKYTEFSKAAGLSVKPKKLTVSGYH